MKYKIWNRQDEIRGIAPELFLSFEPFKNYNGDIILILNDNDIIVSVENKKILSEIYNININLQIDLFMKEVFKFNNYQENNNEEILQQELSQSNEDNIENE